MCNRATGTDPFKTAPRRLRARPHSDLDTPFDFSSTNDTIGGNFVYDPALDRAVASGTVALLSALRVVYGDQALVES